MQQKQLIFAILIFMMSFGITMAQDEETTVRIWSPIEMIETESLVSDDDGLVIWDVTITGFHTDACEYDLGTDWTLYENNIDVQIYRDVPIAATCLRQDTPFETSLTLEIPMDELSPYLIVNDQVWEVTFFTDDDANDVTTEELVLVGAVIDDVTATFIAADAEDEESVDVYELALMGSHGVGCEIPLVYSVRQLAETTLVGVFNPIDQLAVCPAMIIILDETIAIPATQLENNALVTVNTFVINDMEAQAMSDSNKVMTNINTVSVNVMESSPMQLSIDVSGEHPDGCDYPVMVDQESNGNKITVTVYREVPADVMCPMMLNPYEATIKIDGTFESGSYTITVNGVSQSIDI